MAISIDWATKVISVFQVDLTPISGTLYEMDTDQFRKDLKSLEDGEEGMPFDDTHQHNTEVTVAGVTYARFIEIINGYSITFEDGQYSVRLAGSNNNFFDVENGILNQNQVQIIPGNAAGLIVKVIGSGVTEQDKLDIADRVMDELIADHTIDGSLSYGMMYRTFNNRVCIDPINGNPGTTYPLGLSSHPVSNLADAKTIADAFNIREFQLYNHLVVGAGDNINDYVLHAEQDIDVVITMVAGCTTKNTRFHHLILQGTFNGKSYIDHSTTLEIFNYSGFIIDSIFMDNISVVDPLVPSLFSLCGGGKVSPPVEINLGNSSLNIGGWKSTAKLVGKTGSGTSIIELMSGVVEIDSTCVAGKLSLKGIGRVAADNSGPGCEVCTKDLVNRHVIADQTWDESGQDHVIPGSMGGNLNTIKNIEDGRWKIDKVLKQMIFYKPDNMTEVARFSLLDSAGAPAYEEIFERVKLTTTSTTTKTNTTTTTSTTSTTSTTTTTTV